MKTTALFLAGAMMLASASTAAAQATDTGARAKMYSVPCNWQGDSKLVLKRYKSCLASENQGVVEAALGHILWISVAVPCVDVTPLRADVERLAIKGSSSTIRFQAYLTMVVLDDPDGYRALATREFEAPGDLFAGVTRQMYEVASSGLYSAVESGQ